MGLGATPAWAVTHDEIMSVLNAERAANDLPLLVEDQALSAGCAAHNNYEMLNGSPSGYLFRDEDPSLPGYTPEGDRAAANSAFSVGDRPEDSFANGDPFDTAPMHLFNLMEPDLKTIGVDQLDFDAGDFGTISLICIDTRSAPRRPPPKRHGFRYTYVGPQGVLPATSVYDEGPGAGAPSGSWVFVYYRLPERISMTLLSSRILDQRGDPYPVSNAFETARLSIRGAHTRNVEKGFGAPIPAHGFQVGTGAAEPPDAGWLDYCNMIEREEIARSKKQGDDPVWQKIIHDDWEFARTHGRLPPMGEVLPDMLGGMLDFHYH